MGKLRSYDFRCGQCDVDFDAIVVLDEEENMQEPGAFVLPICPCCAGTEEVKRIPSAPAVLKASWPDGRKRPDSWYIAKEAARLRKESFNLHPSKRGELASESRKLETESAKRFKSEE